MLEGDNKRNDNAISGKDTNKGNKNLMAILLNHLSKYFILYQNHILHCQVKGQLRKSPEGVCYYFFAEWRKKKHQVRDGVQNK